MRKVNSVVYALIDDREVDRYTNIKLFACEIDAVIMMKSFGKDSEHFDIHMVEVIE